MKNKMMSVKKTIKTFIYCTFLFTGMIMTSCSNNSSTGEKQIDLSEEKDLRQEAYDQILNDEALLNEFLDQMRQDSTSMHYMMQHQPFMRQMFSQENVDYIMQHHRAMDLELMQNMMDVIQRDTSLEREWEMMYGEQRDHMDQMQDLN